MFSGAKVSYEWRRSRDLLDARELATRSLSSKIVADAP
jgi:hypothetical protein